MSSNKQKLYGCLSSYGGRLVGRLVGPNPRVILVCTQFAALPSPSPTASAKTALTFRTGATLGTFNKRCGGRRSFCGNRFGVGCLSRGDSRFDGDRRRSCWFTRSVTVAVVTIIAVDSVKHLINTKKKGHGGAM